MSSIPSEQLAIPHSLDNSCLLRRQSRRVQLRIQLVQRLVRLDLEVVQGRELLEHVLVDEVEDLRGSRVASRNRRIDGVAAAWDAVGAT